MKVAFISSEVTPFAKTGGLADVCGSLPESLIDISIPTIIIMPYYRGVDLKGYNLQKLSEKTIKVNMSNACVVYFVKEDKYFDRDALYGSMEKDYPDNLERYYYFCEQSLEIIRRYESDVEIVHCHDWQTGLVPVLLKTCYKEDKVLSKVKSLLTIHNLAFQGVFSWSQVKCLDFPQDLFNEKSFEFYGKISLLKAGIRYCDGLTTVSPNYANEIQTSEFSCGLEETMKMRSDDVLGILNGIDYNIWNPSVDEHLLSQYDKSNYREGKKANKRYLQEYFKLDTTDVPLFGFVGRITHQKGFDLIMEAIKGFDGEEGQFLIQGLGDLGFMDELKDLAKTMKRKVGIFLEFDETMAHRIYAGSDVFLMPSRFEPCGLSQMISLSYGTLPLVYNTGGLKNTVIHYTESTGNGFVFEDLTVEELVKTMIEASSIFKMENVFDTLIQKAFLCDFSWTQSANKYKEVYQCLLLD